MFAVVLINGLDDTHKTALLSKATIDIQALSPTAGQNYAVKTTSSAEKRMRMFY